MRYSLLVCLSVAFTLVLGSRASAQKNEITGLRVGFPASGIARQGKISRIKTGHWAPVYVDVTVRDRLNKADYELLVETTDSDDLMNVYRESGGLLPPIDPNQPETLMTYVRVGHQASEISVKFRSLKEDRQLDSAEVGSRNQSNKAAAPDTLAPNMFVYLTIGDSLPGMRTALAVKNKQGESDEEGGNRRYTYLDSVQQMPTRWFGYDSVDVVMLMTSNKNFMNALIQEKDDGAVARREALAEWVRRGGRLVISVRKNHQEVNTLLERLKIIDVKIDGDLPLPTLPGLEAWAHARQANLNNVEVAKLKLGPGVQRLATQQAASADTGDDTSPPVLVQAPAGLGRVMLVALDVNEAPFSAWREQEAFWQQMKTTLEPPGIDGNAANVNFGWDRSTNELGANFQSGLEKFPEVPVISFGWVALFILIYIIIVGPLDYFFLKKVVKRLELTWITFPTVVILISGIAYFAAYYLKGSDLRINKVDVVDIDMREPHVYGNSWLTLFSPRIQNYTVGIDPAPEWVPGLDRPEADRALKDRDPNGAFVSWMGKPESGPTGGGGGSPGLFRRAYDYAPDSSGLKGVPIQVWSTKSFSASWHRPLAPEDMDKLIESDLKLSKGDKLLSGTLTSHLPVELDQVVLIHRGRLARLDKFTPGQQRRVDDLGLGGLKPGESLRDWFSGGFRPTAPVSGGVSRKSGPGFNAVEGSPAPTYVKSMLFFGHPDDAAGQQQFNSNLRQLDERWRLDPNNRDEVILIGRAVRPAELGTSESAEKITQSGLSPGRLWLGDLPAPKRLRPSLVGTLSQETYVRIYIPVK